jgi:hypothetical protein
MTKKTDQYELQFTVLPMVVQFVVTVLLSPMRLMAAADCSIAAFSSAWYSARSLSLQSA